MIKKLPVHYESVLARFFLQQPDKKNVGHEDVQTPELMATQFTSDATHKNDAPATFIARGQKNDDIPVHADGADSEQRAAISSELIEEQSISHESIVKHVRAHTNVLLLAPYHVGSLFRH